MCVRVRGARGYRSAARDAHEGRVRARGGHRTLWRALTPLSADGRPCVLRVACGCALPGDDVSSCVRLGLRRGFVGHYVFFEFLFITSIYAGQDTVAPHTAARRTTQAHTDLTVRRRERVWGGGMKRPRPTRRRDERGAQQRSLRSATPSRGAAACRSLSGTPPREGRQEKGRGRGERRGSASSRPRTESGGAEGGALRRDAVFALELRAHVHGNLRVLGH